VRVVSSSFGIRPATNEDEVRVVALWHACEMVASYNDPASDFQFAIKGPASQVLVAEDSNEIVGAVMVGHDGHRGWMYYVAASPTARGTGIGKAVVNAAEDWLRDRGVAKVQILVRESNTKVVGFYEHLGFETTPRVVMAKWLDR